MRPATAVELAQADKAIAEVRRLYTAAAPKVAAQADRWFATEADKQVAGAFAQVGSVLERWAKVHRAALVAGRWEDGRSQTLEAFLEFGRKELADAVQQVSAEAYDRSLFAAVKVAAAETAAQVNPVNWPMQTKLLLGAGVAVVLVVAVAVLARR